MQFQALSRRSSMQLESLERRQLFCDVASSAVVEPVMATSAVVARPAVVTVSSLDGTYSGVALAAAGKITKSAAAKVKISDDGTHLTGTIVLSKLYSFKLDLDCTLSKTAKHTWTAQVIGLAGSATIHVTDGGVMTLSGSIFSPLLPKMTFNFTGSRLVSASPATTSSMVANYAGTLATGGLLHLTYPTTASIQHATGADLKLTANITIPTFGTLIGTYVFPATLTNRFTIVTGKNSSGQTESLSGQLDKRGNLVLTFFAPPQPSLTGTLNRLKNQVI